MNFLLEIVDLGVAGDDRSRPLGIPVLEGLDRALELSLREPAHPGDEVGKVGQFLVIGTDRMFLTHPSIPSANVGRGPP